MIQSSIVFGRSGGEKADDGCGQLVASLGVWPLGDLPGVIFTFPVGVRIGPDPLITDTDKLYVGA